MTLVATCFGAMLFEPCAQRLRFFTLRSGQVRVDIGWWWCGWGPHEFVQHPSPTQNRRSAVAIGSAQQNSTLAKKAPALRILQFHAPELRPENCSDTVVARKPFVQKRMAGSEQFVNVSVLKQHT